MTSARVDISNLTYFSAADNCFFTPTGGTSRPAPDCKKNSI